MFVNGAAAVMNPLGLHLGLPGAASTPHLSQAAALTAALRSSQPNGISALAIAPAPTEIVPLLQVGGLCNGEVNGDCADNTVGMGDDEGDGFETVSAYRANLRTDTQKHRYTDKRAYSAHEHSRKIDGVKRPQPTVNVHMQYMCANSVFRKCKFNMSIWRRSVSL